MAENRDKGVEKEGNTISEETEYGLLRVKLQRQVLFFPCHLILKEEARQVE
jgi:hypothetical protein